MAKLNVVGTGPGSPDFVIPAARKAVREAQLVVGAERSLKLFRDDIKGQTLTLTGKNVEESLKSALYSAAKGKTVTLLSTGDPGFSGLLSSVLRRSIDESFEINVIPGVSSLQACAAKLCMSWDNVALFAFHDGVNDEKKQEFADVVKAGKTVFLLPDPKNFSPSQIASYLLKSGAAKETCVEVCENLTLDNEKTFETTLEKASKDKFASLCVMVIKSNLKE